VLTVIESVSPANQRAQSENIQKPAKEFGKTAKAAASAGSATHTKG